MEALIWLGVALGLLVVGLLVGGHNERRHLRALDRRERALAHIRVNNLKTIRDPGGVRDAALVTGQVVIATDYFKTFATGLRNIVGGEMGAARSLMLRGRREALLRLLEQAERRGATEIWNLRYGFSNISMMRARSGAIQVEIFAWGTAVKR